MKTVQFNANNILCGNNYPIAYDITFKVYSKA